VPLTAQDVAEITRLLEQSDFLELRLEHEGFRLTLKRAGARDSAMESATAAQAAGPSRPVPASDAAAAPAFDATPNPSAASDPSLMEVTAPLLGIFYRAPRPGAAPYVEVGSVLEEGTVIGIIEVMKLMNSVRAEVRGTVVEILAADGAAVEQGQVLLRVARESAGG
jgi:acetyl-CoA carboxylase biotin carboxyl carrier protein